MYNVLQVAHRINVVKHMMLWINETVLADSCTNQCEYIRFDGLSSNSINLQINNMKSTQTSTPIYSSEIYETVDASTYSNITRGMCAQNALAQAFLTENPDGVVW